MAERIQWTVTSEVPGVFRMYDGRGMFKGRDGWRKIVEIGGWIVRGDDGLLDLDSGGALAPLAHARTSAMRESSPAPAPVPVPAPPPERRLVLVREVGIDRISVLRVLREATDEPLTALDATLSVMPAGFVLPSEADAARLRDQLAAVGADASLEEGDEVPPKASPPPPPPAKPSRRRR